MNATCTFCDDPGRALCPRCGTAVCEFHGPYTRGLACRRCEDEWDRGHRKRLLMLFPIGAVTLLVSIAVIGGACFVITGGNFSSTGMFVVILGGPISATVAVSRWVTKVFFRRRFFTRAPPRIPAAKVVSR